MPAVPRVIAFEVLRQQEAMGWPDTVPAYAFLENGMIKRHTNLTVADCEQLVEFHSRKARAILQRWDTYRSRPLVRIAARHILLARLYRCRFIGLTKQTDVTEADMPFPNFYWEGDDGR